MTYRQQRRLDDGTIRYDVRYRNAAGRQVRRTFTDSEQANLFETVVDAAIRRWPLQPLLDRCELDTIGLAHRLGLDPRNLRPVVGHGLSDVQADTWAIATGWHPLEVWGWAWIDAGLAFGPLDPAQPDPLTPSLEAAA
jgi:hypothetical protein